MTKTKLTGQQETGAKEAHTEQEKMGLRGGRRAGTLSVSVRVRVRVRVRIRVRVRVRVSVSVSVRVRHERCFVWVRGKDRGRDRVILR